VVYTSQEDDNDFHARLSDKEGNIVIFEIIPKIPLTKPKVGDFLLGKGILRFDKAHNWYELNPVEELTKVSSCPKGEE